MRIGAGIRDSVKALEDMTYILRSDPRTLVLEANMNLIGVCFSIK
jgi:hypothetical protein